MTRPLGSVISDVHVATAKRPGPTHHFHKHTLKKKGLMHKAVAFLAYFIDEILQNARTINDLHGIPNCEPAHQKGPSYAVGSKYGPNCY